MGRLISIGLTGGIACGKSAVAHLLARRGAYLICTDTAARQALMPESSAWKQVVREFGHGILRKNGEIDRKKLGEMVFANTSKRARLEAIVHPQVRHIWRRQLAQCAREQKFRVAVVDVPLLYEVNIAHLFKAVVVVGASLQTQRARLQARGLRRRSADQRIAAQWPLQKKVDLADYVVWNDGSRAQLERQVEVIWRKISGRPKSKS